MSRKPSVLAIRAGSLQNQHHITTLCNFLVGQGFALTLVSIHSKAEEPPPLEMREEIRFIRIPFTAGRGLVQACSRLLASFRLRRHLVESAGDVIDVLDSPALQFFWLASLGYRVGKSRRLVYHTCEWLDPAVASSWHIALERRIARRADLVVNADRSRAHLMQSFYQLGKTPLDVPVYLPLETCLPKRDPARRQEWLCKDALADAVLVICPTVASPERMTLQLIDGFARLPARYHLFTVAKDDPYGRSCAKQVEDSELGKRVILSPPLEYINLLKVVADSDIGIVFHDPRGSAGNFMCHSSRMSMFVGLGIPFVGTDVPNLAAVVYRYQLGVCCDPFDVAAIASAIRGLAEQPPSLSARRQHIRSVFQSEMCFERQAVRLAAELRRLATVL